MYVGGCAHYYIAAFAAFARQTGSQAKLARAAEEVNASQAARVVRMVREKLGDLTGKTIAVLGLTYKPNTDIVLDSDSVKIAAALLGAGARLNVYDPAGMENAGKVLGRDNIRYAASAPDCLRGAELCILATPWDEFKDLKPEDFVRNMKKPVLLDCWRLLRRPEFLTRLDYLAVGLNQER